MKDFLRTAASMWLISSASIGVFGKGTWRMMGEYGRASGVFLSLTVFCAVLAATVYVLADSETKEGTRDIAAAVGAAVCCAAGYGIFEAVFSIAAFAAVRGKGGMLPPLLFALLLIPTASLLPERVQVIMAAAAPAMEAAAGIFGICRDEPSPTGAAAGISLAVLVYVV